MSKFPNLFSPIQIGSYMLRNRIEAAPTLFSSLALIPEISDRVLRMIEDRAKGGCAIVVNGEIPVNFDDSLRPIVAGKGKVLEVSIDYRNYEEPAFAIFQKNAAVIKKHGAIAIAELSHFGVEKPLLADGILPLGPTAYTKADGTPVRAFDKQTMGKVKNDFAEAAAFMQAAGFQGVFLHYGHGWLLGQFLSNRNNKRTDEYGGSLGNRARFPLEVLQAVRERCGAGFLIEIRLSGQENMPGG
ncbi:MAG: NADH-flavin oxidoreductase, Old yellow enzyme family, partial [Sporomusa sp.]|nr:NADH-flavin oxidoreductase, Old yellow enzyme family [Sporomusa sp.]